MKVRKTSFWAQIENGIFRNRFFRPNLGLNDRHARARMGKHMTKLISLYLFSLYQEHFLKV